MYGLVTRVLLLKAFSAVDRLVTAGLKWYLGGSAAAVADDFIHLAIAAASASSITITFVGPAGRATAWFIREALFSEESLFGTGENEFGAAVTAG
jgi:hypothetical protein